jgi:hypothetical protein
MAAVSNQDQPPYFKVEILFAHTLNYKSSTITDLYEPKFHLVPATTYKILVL